MITLQALYGTETSRHTTRLAQLHEKFAQRFGQGRTLRVFSSPGRSEIGGNHTDHNHGKVLAAAVNLDILGVVAANDTMRICVYSAGHKPNDLDITKQDVDPKEYGTSAAMIRGICAAFVQRGYQIGGFDGISHSEVLSGSGLSSSAAFEVYIATILNHMYNDGKIDAVTIAQMCQYSENVYAGKPCGLLDQATCAVAGFVAMDFADPATPVVNKVDFDFAATGHALCVVNTGGSHADLRDDYAAVRAEMQAAARVLDVEFLRDTTRENLMANIAAVRKACGDRAVLRALHFYAENDKVDAQRAALESGDFAAFLQLIKASGRSSYMYNQNVYTGRPPSEQPVSLGLALSETLLGERGAWRVHGGGFAGTIQAFVPVDMLDTYRTEMEKVFGAGSCYVLQVRPHGGVELHA
ncbi:MAG: galactokinase [Oscillospiraceae bacterium]|nr:galactokinase [Oscillospiraceae bacterium]